MVESSNCKGNNYFYRRIFMSRGTMKMGQDHTFGSSGTTEDEMIHSLQNML